MEIDEPGVTAAWIPQNLMFNTNDCTFLVLHKTAGFQTAEECAQYFQAGSGGFGVSAHYVVGQDGAIIQCVPEAYGAGGNCCATLGHAAFIPDSWNGNLDNGNLHSISIEHIDPASDNSTPLTSAQKKASFKLILHICQRHNIPLRYARDDGQGGICGHKDIDPINRGRCPGNYPWTELFSFLEVNGVDNREKQAAIIWTATGQVLSHCYGSIADYNTPIGNYWRDLCKRGLKPGPPLTLPYNAVDWSGATILCQEFPGGHAEVDQAGRVTFLDHYGNKL